jgi:predicted unusual protein kinase regulating ubiquinone biosynthesis (AarF/ABC1/UbiB family)
MAPLQDKCEATPYEDIAALLLSDMGQPLSTLFDDFDPVPIGVASLAQVHVAYHKASGKKVAVKVCSESVLTGGAYFGCRSNILIWLNSSIST